MTAPPRPVARTRHLRRSDDDDGGGPIKDWLKTRGAGAALHWIAAALLLAGLAAAPALRPGLNAAFAAVAVLWLARVALAGPLAHPRAAAPAVRGLHLALHRGLPAAVALTALAGVAPAAAGLHATLVRTTLALAAGHVAFNLWRAAVRGDRVFSRMLPF